MILRLLLDEISCVEVHGVVLGHAETRRIERLVLALKFDIEQLRILPQNRGRLVRHSLRG